MATYTFNKIDYGGNTYVVSDSGALQLTGGQVTGPVTFGDSISVDEATLGDLVVNGSASFTNNIQVNTINGVAVGSSPKFTDTKAWGSITGKPTATGSNTTGITASTTATKTTLGTANSIYGVSSTTTTASKASGSNGTASSWTFKEQIVVVNIEGFIEENKDTLVIGSVVTPIQSKTGGSNGTAPTWSFTDVTVPIKNSSATSIPNVSVTSATVSITDNGHTHSIS